MDASLFSSSCSLARADWRRKGWGEGEEDGRERGGGRREGRGEVRGEKEEVEK